MHGGLFFLYLAAVMAQDVFEDSLTTEPMAFEASDLPPDTTPLIFRSSFPNSTDTASDDTASATKPLLLVSALILGVLAYGILCIPQPYHKVQIDYDDHHVEAYPAFFEGLIDKP